MNSFLSDGVEIAFVDEGEPSGDPVLLIHGFASSHAVNWRDTGWFKALAEVGRRVIALDNRGHGQSAKLYRPEDYSSILMAEDARALLDHLDIASADVIGYSMGARNTAFLGLRHPGRVRSAVFGGMGERMVTGIGGGEAIAEALEADSAAEVTEPGPLMFRKFAERTGSDLKALAACMRAGRINLSAEDLAKLTMPVLVAVGDADEVGGPAAPLADLMPHGEALVLEDRDHMSAVGSREFKAGVLEFFTRRD